MMLNPRSSPHTTPTAQDFDVARTAWANLKSKQAEAIRNLEATKFPDLDEDEWILGYATARATGRSQNFGDLWRRAPDETSISFRVGYSSYMTSIGEG